MAFFEIMKGTNLWILIAIITGGLIVTGYTAVQHFKSVKADIEATKVQVERDSIEKEFRKQIAEKNQQIIDSQKEANSKLGDANKKSDELVQVYRQLNDANTKIQHIQNESIKLITGEGIPKIEINNFSSNQFSIRLFNDGDYPFYDLEISVVDINLLTELCPFTMHEGILYGDLNCIVSNTVRFNTNSSIREHGGAVLNPTISLKEGFNNLQFTVHARHKSYLYRYIINNSNQIINCEYRVYDGTNPERTEVFRFGNLNLSDNYWDDNFLPLKLRYGRVLRSNEKR
jgi:hypothetical protein